MILLVLILITVLLVMLPGVYLSVKHVLGYEGFQGNTLRALEQGEGAVVFVLRTGLFLVFSFFSLAGISALPVYGIVAGLIAGALFALFNLLILYIINNPPTKGIQSVKVFYQGKLADLGGNLKNALRNTFEQIENW